MYVNHESNVYQTDYITLEHDLAKISITYFGRMALSPIARSEKPSVAN